MPVTLTAEARDQLAKLPASIIARVDAIVTRLERWPNVSGAKSLKGDLAGYCRIRTGDYRVMFRVEPNQIVITQIGKRDRFYD